jgi:HK97 family phage prohead protease
MNRAYSLLHVKAVDEDARVISGIATTPEPDRIGDIIEPLGVKFKNPMPLLSHHRSDQPIGTVKFHKPTESGITFEAKLAKIDEPGPLKERVDTAWLEVKHGLVRGASIGFRPIERSFIEGGGIRFMETEVLELSLVTIAANAEATIQSIKSIDASLLAASGHDKQTRPVRLEPPGVSGKRTVNLRPQEGKHMATIAEQIVLLENKRAAHLAAQQTVTEKGIDEGRTSNETEDQEFDNLQAEIETIDKNLNRLHKLEKNLAVTAKPVIKAETQTEASEVRGSAIVVKTPPKLEPGISYTQLVKVRMSARLTGDSPLVMAKRMYGENSEVFGIVTKANEVVAGTTLSGNWAYDLVSQEGAAVAAFLEYLRPATIVGKFGTDGIPNLTRIDFYSPYVIETGAGDAYWVGEGKPKPLTAGNYDRATLTPLKIANIAVLTEENIRYSSPNSDTVVRNVLVKAISTGLDVAFIDPANSGSANVKPASITNGAESVTSTGDTESAIRVDIRALFQKFILANNPPMSGVWIMSASNALALASIYNPLGQRAFGTIEMTGGTLAGLPVIVSQQASLDSVVVLVNAGDIFLGDEGGVAVDMSREASIEMRSSGLGMDATAGTATTGSVSMFQTNSVALRAERTISWKRARESAVAYLTSVDWGGEVPTD